MLLNLLLLVCVAAAVIGFWRRRSDPQSSPLLIVAPATLALVLVLLQIVLAFFFPQRAREASRAHREVLESYRFEYAAGSELARLAQQQGATEALVLIPAYVRDLTEGPAVSWLRGVQEAAKSVGLKTTLVTVQQQELLPARASAQFSLASLKRIAGEHPQTAAWICFFAPKPVQNPAEMSDLVVGKYHIYCYAQHIAAHDIAASWWTNSLQKGLLAAVVFDRYDYSARDQRPAPVKDPKANFEAGFVRLTRENPQVPPELVEQLDPQFRR